MGGKSYFVLDDKNPHAPEYTLGGMNCKAALS
jgi:hypothetical protein